MDAVIRTRRTLNRNVTKFEKDVDAIDPLHLPPIPHLTLLAQTSNDLKIKLEAWIQDLGNAAADDLEFDTEEALFVPIEDAHIKSEKKLTVIMASLPVPITPLKTTADVKLPKLEIPTFSGNIQDWISFHDIFNATIHSNKSLSGCQKLQYLRSSVKGEASQLIQSLQVTDDNYPEAWRILQERYENQRELVRSIFERLIALQNIQQENPAVLRKLLDTANECVRALLVLKVPPEKIGDLLIIHILTKKLDTESRLQWEKSLKTGDIPTYSEFYKFLDNHARVTAAAGVNRKPAQKPQGTSKATAVHLGTASTSQTSYTPTCAVCSESHSTYTCPTLNEMPVSARYNEIIKRKLCFNCLGKHKLEDCKNKRVCQICKERHHTILHKDKKEKTQPENAKEETAVVASHSSSRMESSFQTLLSTAIILMKDKYGITHVVRAFIDNGSQASFITTKLANKLGFRQYPTDVPINGIGETQVTTDYKYVMCNLSSVVKEKQNFNLKAIILPSITGNLPSHTMTKTNWRHLEGLVLADPEYHISKQVDVLLGSDIYATLIEDGIRKGPIGSPTAQNTALGWALFGPTRYTHQAENELYSHHVGINSVMPQIQKFWELEEISKSRLLTKQEKSCELHFDTTHTRDENGKFTVRLPFKINQKKIGESRNGAVRRLYQLERRFVRNPELGVKYANIIQEYLDLGHMEAVPEQDLNKPTNQIFYMPHHGVIKESSKTTPIRVVFDASAKSTSGFSLNDNLHSGPKLQEDLISILMRFRTHRIALTADIAKMYRQFKIHPDDVDFQRIVWRRSVKEPIQDFRLITATFGTTAAPYLAIKCVQQLAKTEEDSLPNASTRILNDLYVDDLLTGCDTELEGIQIQKELLNLMSKGCLQLRKWSSNSEVLLKSLPSELRETNLPMSFDEDEAIKTLGLIWHPGNDNFSFTFVPTTKNIGTKRTLLSELARVFDPLGWLSPVTITAKILFQQRWEEKMDWDDPLPTNIQEKWNSYQCELPLMKDILIPRCIVNSKEDSYELHGFCDSSEKAYAAAVYLKSTSQDGIIKIHLVAAKTKVAPLKQVSLPRLELCGATLLSRLVILVQDALKLKIEKITGWTDSTIVLNWISSSPQRWKTFVANRVSEIQEVIPAHQWQHVRSEDNPADCASRGILTSQLCEHPLWWHGPPWLSTLDNNCQVQNQIPNLYPSQTQDIAKEERKSITTCVCYYGLSNIQSFSNFTTLLRVTAWSLRFIFNATPKNKSNRRKGPLTTTELSDACMNIVKSVQSAGFAQEIHTLERNQPLHPKCKILSLAPFLDSQGILRVGGRLRNSTLPDSVKYPILLPKQHYFTKLVISYYHLKHLHAGSQLLLAALQQKFWIPCGRDVVRKQIAKCIVCFRQRAQMTSQLMADLPASRVTPARAFLQCGVDYGGPFILKASKGRCNKTTKAYLALFICFSTRAIHLELVSDMTTEAFLAALKRFVARRGKPSDIHSDCGSNFVGAKRVMADFLQIATSASHNQSIQQHLANDGINWHLNPSGSPHFGGIWEAGIKSTKFHLKRIIQNMSLTYEELNTIFCQVEACLNSRPLTPLSTDPNDFTALAPGHFLIGQPLTTIPEPDLQHLKQNRVSRWEMCQKLVQHFWSRWSKEYLSRLQQRPKWLSAKENVKIDDLVLIKDENLPPLKWKPGRIIALHPGKDNLTRVVTLKTANGTLKRPVVKISVLPLDKD